MDVSEAVLSRSSVRAFKSTRVSNQLIKKILKKAFFFFFGGNLQPWKIYIVNGNSMNKFLKFVKEWKDPEAPAYDIYPPKLKEPYRTYRYELGEQMYSLLNIPREDKEGRINQVLKNFEFFGAPCGLFCFIDKTMGPPQWSDLGMFLQTFMLLAREEGLDTCAQEAWSIKHSSVSEFLKVDQDHILFCGMAIGYRDENSPINNLKSERKPFDKAVKFI